MPSPKGKLIRLLGGMLLKSGRVARVEDVGQSFRLIEVGGDFETPAPGAKVQLLLPSDDVRTYTPVAIEPGKASMLILGWKGASGPGARWVSEVRAGAELSFVGPGRSLELADGPVIFVGDETSVAAAASFALARRGLVHSILAGQSRDDLAAASAAVGLTPTHLASQGAIDEVARAVLAARATAPSATVALTGGSELVIAVRSALRSSGLREVKTKTYWAPGKSGLD